MCCCTKPDAKPVTIDTTASSAAPGTARLQEPEMAEDHPRDDDRPSTACGCSG